MKKKIFILIIKIVIGIALLCYVIYKMSPGWEKSKICILELVQNNQGLLLLGILCFGGVLIAGVFRWQLLLRAHKVNISTIDATKLLFIGHFFSQFMPGGIAGGDIVKSFYITNHTDDRKHEAVTTIFIDRLVGILGLFGVLLIAILANIGSIGYFSYVIIVLCLLGASLILTFLFFSKRIINKLPGIEHLKKKIPYKEFVTRIYNAFNYYKDHKRVMLLTFLLSVFIHFLLTVMTYCIALGLGLQIAFKKYLVLVSLVNFVGSIPISPLGTMGTLDGAYIFFFESESSKASGIPGALALMVRMIYALWGLAGLVIWLFGKSGLKIKKSERITDNFEKQNIKV